MKTYKEKNNVLWTVWMAVIPMRIEPFQKLVTKILQSHNETTEQS